MFKRILAVAVVATAIAACGGQAQAADITFKTTDNKAFSLHNVYSVEGGIAGQFVRVTYINGGSSLIQDVGGSVYTKILQNMPQLVQIGTQSLIDPTYAASIFCQSGVSKFALQGSSLVVEVNDSCTSANQAIAKAK